MAAPGLLVESYAKYLYAKHRKIWRQYVNRPYEAALAEAAVFRILQKCEVKPEVADYKSGPDFECTGGKFMVEATAFMSDKVTDGTTLRDEPPTGEVGGQAYGMLTRQIAEKADSKHYQFASLGKPGILAIASGHQWASLVLNRYAAEPHYFGTVLGRYTAGNVRQPFAVRIHAARWERRDRAVPYRSFGGSPGRRGD